MSQVGRVPVAARLSQLAEEHPSAVAIHFAPAAGDVEQVTWQQLDEASTRAAHLLTGRGVTAGSFVVVGVGNTPTHYVATFGAWKLGACVVPVAPRLPAGERDRLLEVSVPAAIVADWNGVDGAISSDDLIASDAGAIDRLPEETPSVSVAFQSSGSTGKVKLIVDAEPWSWDPDELADGFPSLVGFRPGQVQLVPGGLYSGTYFAWGHLGLFEDQQLVLMERFDAPRAVDLIRELRVQFSALVPTMMRRIVLLPDLKPADLASIEGVMHTGAMCPAWLKRAWIDLLGPEKVFEAYGGNEGIGETLIGGREWLEHPGTVGRPLPGTELRIRDENGLDLPPGEVGEIYLRKEAAPAPYRYLGAPPLKGAPDGFVTLGDLGWVDESGYLYLADRRVDMIVTGGFNVFPAEVEAVLLQHQAVVDVVVVGVPDAEWGRRVHAIVQPEDIKRPPPVDGLDARAREGLASFKAPKSYEFLASLPRDDGGKIRRSDLVTERESGWTAGMIWAPQHSVARR